MQKPMLARLLLLPRLLLLLALEVSRLAILGARFLLLAIKALFLWSSLQIRLLLRRKKRRNRNMMQPGMEVFSDAPEIPKEPGAEQGAPDQAAGPNAGLSEAEDNRDLEELCSDLVALPFDAWEMVAARPKALSAWEKTLMGKRLAKIIEKRPALKEKITDELILASVLTIAVGRRIKDERSHKNTGDSRKEGAGKVNQGEGDNKSGA